MSGASDVVGTNVDHKDSVGASKMSEERTAVNGSRDAEVDKSGVVAVGVGSVLPGTVTLDDTEC